MRKLGLRMLAGSLAVLMTVSVFGPVTPARAENDLLIAPAPIAANTLYITKDMVDSDNEIIISGEKWDRIVVTKEAAAANIYFDEVEVGELVIESGSKSTIQLWNVDAGKVTVQEPELKEIDMTGLRVLLAEQETRQQAIDYFMRVQAENEQVLRSAPLVMTMEDASVETLSAGANVRLDLHEGDVKALNVEASAKLDRMDVTVEGYRGEVVYSGNDVFSIVNLKNVDSRISKLTVADSSASNYLNVSSRDSLALKVEVAGDAKVSLNIPMGELNITEAAKAASVDVLNAVDNMNVSGSNAKVEIAPIGNVTKASITGDKAEISGAGVLGEAVILGKEVYVSTKGTDVEGENCYVEPVYEAPKVVVRNTYDNMEAGATTLTKNSNGTATISFSGQYQSATFNVPETVDVNRIRSITVEVTTGGQFGISIITKGGEAVVSEYPGYGISSPTKKEFTYSVNPAEQKIAKINLMSLNAAQPDMTLESVTFNLYEEGKAPTAKPTPLPTAPSELDLPAGSKEYQFADMLPCEGWGNTVSADAPHGGIKAAYERQYACTKFVLPEALTVGDFEKIILTASSGTGPLGIELYDAEDKIIGFWWNKKVTATTDLQLTYNTTGYGGGDSIAAANLAKQVVKVNVMYHGDGDGAEVILYRIAFVAKPGGGNTPEPTPGVTETPEPTPGITETPEPTPGVTETPEPTPDVTGTPTPTPTPTSTPTPNPVTKVELDLNDLNVVGAVDGSVKHNADGSVEISYEKNYQGTSIAIPAEYANLKYVEVSVSSTQGGEALADGNQIALRSAAGEITTLYGSGVKTYIVPDDVTLTSIVINSQKAAEGNPQVQTIQHIKLAAVVNLDLADFNKGGAVSMTTNDDGSVTCTFDGAAYTGSHMPIPEEYQDCTYFEVHAEGVESYDDTSGEAVAKPGVQVSFVNTAGEKIGGDQYIAWSGYVARLEIPEGQTLAKIIVNNQEKKAVLTIHYVKARY